MNCKNCNEIVEGNFCSNCGQASAVEKLTYKSLTKDITSNVFQFNSGFLYTLKILFKQPDVAINNFLSGKRVRIAKPITYLVAASTIYFLLAQLTHVNTWMDDLITGFSNGLIDDEEIPIILTWFSKNYAYTTLLTLPLFSLGSFISFKNQKFNFVEHVVLNAYITGQQAIIYAVFCLTRVISNIELFEILPLYISISYLFYAFMKIFNKTNLVSTFFRTVLSYIIYLFLSLIGFLIALRISELVNYF